MWIVEPLCNNGGKHRWVGSGPPASRDPTARFQGEDAIIPNIPRGEREISATYIDDTSQEMYDSDLGGKGCVCMGI